MTNSRIRFNSVLAKVHESLPRLTLQTFTAIPKSNNSVFRITASHIKPANNRELLIKDYIAMASEQFGESLQLVPGSIEHVGNSSHNCMVSALVAANVISKPVSRDELKTGFKMVSANVFMDDEDKIWRMQGDGDNRRLVQAIKEDFTALLASRVARSSTIVAGDIANYMGVTPNRGDYAIFYNTTAMDYDYGFTAIADGEIYVAPRTSTGIEKIVPEQIIDCVENADLPMEKRDTKILSMMLSNPKATTGNFSGDMAQEYLNYYRQIYADTPFFAAMEEHIANRRNLADINKPISTMDIS